MTETTIATIVVAVCAAAPPTILAFASLRQSRVTAATAQAVAKQVEVNDKKTDAIIETTTANDRKTDSLIEKTTEIHTLTNGNLHVVTGALATANEKIAGLERIMARLLGDEQVRLNVAAAAAIPQAAPAPADPTPTPNTAKAPV